MSLNRTFKTVDYDRTLDLTVRLGDWLPLGHLVRFVVDSVTQLDLSAFFLQNYASPSLQHHGLSYTRHSISP